MNMKMPDQCNEMECPNITQWVTPRGVNDTAADMKNFQHEEMKETLAELDTNLDVFKMYEDALIAKEKEAANMTDALFPEIDKMIEEIEKDTGTTPVVRMLDTTDEVILKEVEDTDANAIDAGQDSQIEDTEADAVTEIDQTAPTAALETIENLSEDDTGVVGEDSTNLEDKDEGMGMMTWIMIIGGAVLLLALIAGAIHVI